MRAGKVVNESELETIIRERGAEGRSVTAIAGPPGSGKSTLAARLVERLNAADPDSAAVFPMDGYHFDDMILVPRGWRPRKGAPHTFDVAGFAAMLSRLRANAEPEIAVPVFDRDIEIARNSARIIRSSVRHVIVEGNYLMLQLPPWQSLSSLFDTTVFLDVPLSVIRSRLEQRWAALSPEEFARKLEGNDIPNAMLVLEQSREGEFKLQHAPDIAAQV